MQHTWIILLLHIDFSRPSVCYRGLKIFVWNPDFPRIISFFVTHCQQTHSLLILEAPRWNLARGPLSLLSYFVLSSLEATCTQVHSCCVVFETNFLSSLWIRVHEAEKNFIDRVRIRILHKNDVKERLEHTKNCNFYLKHFSTWRIFNEK